MIYPLAKNNNKQIRINPIKEYLQLCIIQIIQINTQQMQATQKQEKHLKSLLCQIKPIFKEKNKNLARVKKSLQHYTKDNKLDIVMFPEMSFTGYNFQDQKDALPLAIKAGEGEQFEFAKAQALRLNAYILFGYIQVQEKEGKITLYNSVGIINRKGEIEKNLRKTFLYYADKFWCQEGDGFKSIVIQNLKGQKFKCALAICMDINPKQFTSGEWEFGEFALKEKAQVILFLTNWVDSQADQITDKAVISMYEYWIHRLTPILNKKKENSKPPILFLAADRVGTEYSYFDKKNTHFFGSSCGLMLNPPYLISRLGKKDEGYLLIDGKLPK